MILNSFLVLVQGWSSFKGKFQAVNFVSLYIELPVMLLMFVAWKLWRRTKFVKLEDMDFETDVFTPEPEEEEKLGAPWQRKSKGVLNWLF